LLFKIDPRPFMADFNNKQAAVAQAKASAAKAKADNARNTELLQAQVIAQSDYDTTKATYLEDVASLNAAEAALETLDASDSVAAAPPVTQTPPDMRTAFRSDSRPSKERQ
jgi:multidrug resistance efflux pump